VRSNDSKEGEGMRVVEVAELTGPDAVRLSERPEPEPDPGGVLVDVRAIGLSFPDLLRSRGEYQDRRPPPYVLGQEFAGVVLSAPADSGFSPGDRVAGMAGSAAAERLVVEPSALVALPDRLSFEQGAGLIFNYQTALVALAVRGRLRSGEVVLAHGAGGGTGTAVVQVAKALDARVIAVVSSDEKADAARQAGADYVVRSDGAWKDSVLDLTDGRGVDLAFDPVGGDRMLDTIRALAFGGRWVIIGFTGGSIPQIPANRLLLKNVEVVGSYLGGYLNLVPDGRARLLSWIGELMQAGAITPIVGATFPMERGADALRELSERRSRGKVVITVS
jgi:NADPH2:quinone reductase